MKRTSLLLLSLFLASCNETSQQVFVDQGIPSEMIDVESQWTREDGCISGESGYLVSQKLFNGKVFTLNATLSLDSVGFTNASLILFDNYLNFDAKVKDQPEPVIQLAGKMAHNRLVVASRKIEAGKPFALQIEGQSDSVRFYVDGAHLFSCANDVDQYGRVGFRAGKKGIRVYDCSATGLQEKPGTVNYLFQSGTGNYHTFRIPAIEVSTRGTLLAFAEGRADAAHDAGDINLLLKRSEDGGKTWSEPILVLDEGKNTTGNVTPVVDRETGTIFVFSTWNLGDDYEWQIINGTSKDTRRIFVTQSDDDGLTWSPAREITDDVKLPDWTWYATGPCHAIQLSRGEHKGRLVVPCDHIERESKKYYSHVIYSDDHGKTWQLGGTTPSDMVNECTVVELENGHLMLNMRNYDRNLRTRKVSVSQDGGATWGELYSDSVLIEPICQASIARYSFQDEGKSRILFLNPADSLERRNMTLRISYDDGKSWSRSKVVYDGPSAYCDVIRLPNGNIGCLYEAGYIHPYEGIVYEEIELAEIEQEH